MWDVHGCPQRVLCDQGDIRVDWLAHVCADHDYGTDPKTEVPSFLQVTCHHQNHLLPPVNASIVIWSLRKISPLTIWLRKVLSMEKDCTESASQKVKKVLLRRRKLPFSSSEKCYFRRNICGSFPGPEMCGGRVICEHIVRRLLTAPVNHMTHIRHV